MFFFFVRFTRVFFVFFLLSMRNRPQLRIIIVKHYFNLLLADFFVMQRSVRRW